MRRLAGLAFIGAAAVAAGAFASVGGLDRVANNALDPAPRATAAATACFDYNGPLLPGRSRPWLQPLLLTSVPGVPAAFGKSSCMPGTYLYDERLTDDTDGTFFLSGVRLGADGCPLDPLDMYRTLMAVHPQMGGSVGHRLTDQELELLGMTSDDRNYYANATILTRPAGNAEAALRAGSMDGLLVWYRALDVHRLPPIPDRIAKGLGEATCTATSSSTPMVSPKASPTASPSKAPETRRYRVVVNGYENSIPNPGKKTSNGVRFGYRLVGEFTITRPDPSRPWKVASSRIVTADVTYRSLYPVDQYRLTLSCEYSSCQRLRQATRFGVYPHGNEVVVSWGGFNPYIHLTGTCAGCAERVDRWVKSEFFFSRINPATLPLEKAYVGPQTISRYGNGDVEVSFAYGLEQLS